MLINFKKNNCQTITEDNDLEIRDTNNIDEDISLESAITTLQYIKDRYFKNGNPHLSMNRCIKGPIFSWIDYQRNFTENLESLEPISWNKPKKIFIGRKDLA
jgi:hypothetical protein